MTQGAEPRAQRVARTQKADLSLGGSFLGLAAESRNSDWTMPRWLSKLHETCVSLLSSISHLKKKLTAAPIIIILCLHYDCMLGILGQIICFISFKSTEMARNFVHRLI